MLGLALVCLFNVVLLGRFADAGPVAPNASAVGDHTQYVLPFTGTHNGGNMFPGVARPFGTVKLGPDVNDKTDSYSGYRPNGNVTGYSLMHESGTGGAPKYGVVSQMPVVGKISNPLANFNLPRSQNDVAEVGYYKSKLNSSVVIELAATEHAGMFQYTFPSNQQANVVVDVSHVLPSFRGMLLGQNYTGGTIGIAEDGRYEGSGTYNNGWNLAPQWTIYFCGYFDTPHTSAQTFRGSTANDTKYPARFIEAVEPTLDGSTQATRVGAIYTFAQPNVTSRVGVSWISAEKACSNVNNEIPANTTFNSVVSGTKDAWNSQLLSKITTTELLYTMIYGMLLLPSNRTGENPGWQSNEPYYDDIFTLWDLFHCQTSLFQIVQPVAYEEYIRALIDIYRHDGWMPDARSSNFNGRSQGGSNADNVLADAYVKGVRGKVNWEDGYAAMVKDAEVIPPPPIHADKRIPGSSDHQGRPALGDWLKYSYITTNHKRSVSRAAEYSVNDFSLSQVASGLNKTADAKKYLTRSRNWRNHWNYAASALGFSGFLAPRRADGTFVPIDPITCGKCYWSEPYYEATPWEYTFSPYHDVNTLIKLSGGPEPFVNKLAVLFQPGLNPNGSSQFGNTIFDPGNEPSFASPYLFNFARRQDLSVKYSHHIASSYYSPTLGGLPGNSDAGAMQSWVLWNMIGLYPLTGTTTFLIGSPWLPSLSIALGNNKTFTVTTTGREKGIYVQSLKVNGQPWDKNWVAWTDVFANGGKMDFVLGAEPAAWDTGDLPPSPASADTDAWDNGQKMASTALWVAIGLITAFLLLMIVMMVMITRYKRKKNNKDNENKDVADEGRDDGGSG